MSRVVHCWQGKREWIEDTYGDTSDEYYDYMASDEPSSTCMLLEGHDGPHAWTNGNEIVVRFKGEPTKGKR
jgi:hypothetical protein